jgi:hypothetical protein
VPGLLRHAQGDLVIEAEIDEDPDAENLPVQDFDGTVTRIETLTPTIKGVWIKLDAPIRFQAGQYVNLNCPAASAAAPSPSPARRRPAARSSSTSASCRAARAPPTSMNAAGR